MPKYTDEDIRNMSKITCKIAADYLGMESGYNNCTAVVTSWW